MWVVRGWLWVEREGSGGLKEGRIFGLRRRRGGG